MSDEFVMSEEIEALAATLNDALENFYEPFDWHEATRISARILAAGYRKPRTITTVEELDALGLGSVLLDSDSEAVQRIDDETMDGRSLWETELGLVTSGLVMLPATVLYEPLP